MKKKLLYILLVVETLLCAAAALLLSPPDTGGFAAAMQFPFADIGSLLRAMSLSGAAGNAFAFAAYIIISLIPAAFLFVRMIRKRSKAEDILLAVMSGYLFYLMYMMINPANMGSIGMGLESFGKAVLAGVFWSMLVGWLVLKLLRFVKGRDTESILNMLGILFALAAAVVVFGAAYIGVAGLKADIEAVNAGNTAASDMMLWGSMPAGMTAAGDLSPTIAFLVFRFIAGLIPVAADILILLTAKTLAVRLKADRFGNDVVGISEKLARLCKYAVVIIVISSIALNVIQLLAAGSLRAMNYTNDIPLGSVILALVMLLLARFFSEGRKIKQENEMFV